MSKPQSGAATPLSVLDLVPISEGQTSQQAIHNTLDLAVQAEAAGYRRFWLAEHHLNEGVAGSAGHTLLAAIGDRTSRIHLGTAATILGNYSLVQVAEAFGVLAALFPGRVDLGLGRSGSAPAVTPEDTAGTNGAGTPDTGPASAPTGTGADAHSGESRDPAGEPLPGFGYEDAAETASAEAAWSAETGENRIVDGLVVPPRRPFRFHRSKRFGLHQRLFHRHAGDTSEFDEIVQQLLDFFAGTSEAEEVGRFVTPPANGADLRVWVHGSSPGISASVAGRRGLPFGSNYHTAPSNTLEAIATYREHFQPSALLAEPYLTVSADIVVADTEQRALEIAKGYGHWVASIRNPDGNGAIRYPSPEWVDAHPLNDEELARVKDRLDTRFVGTPEQVAERLRILQRATGADELLVTTITHDHADRVRSQRLLAEAWGLAPVAALA